MIKRSISLHNDTKQGGKVHDKVYHIQIVDGSTSGKYTVSFQSGETVTDHGKKKM